LATLLALPTLAPAAAAAPNRASISSIAGARESSGQDQAQRLRAAHVKDRALTKEAREFYDNFESLALERVQVPDRDMKDVWGTATTLFKLTPNSADDARDVVDWYTEIFELTDQVAKQEEALGLLGDSEEGNHEKNKAIKNQKKRVEKSRKRIEKLKKKIQSNIKAILAYDQGDQKQGLENWLLVSTGLLRDEREERESKEMAESLPVVRFAEPEAPDSAADTSR
jgi:hypothetical protein